MSFPGYVFGSSPPVSTRGAEDREPAPTVPGSASPEGTYLAPPQEAVSSAPIDDLWHTVPVAFSEASQKKCLFLVPWKISGMINI